MSKLNPLERILVAVDELPGSAVFRIAIGFAMFLLWSRFDVRDSPWVLPVFFLSGLLLLRLIPGVIRVTVPFSREVKRRWMVRRELGRKYDSYEWRKLFWIGLGLAGYVVLYKDFAPLKVALTGACLLSGAAGALVYQRFESNPARR